MSGRLHINQLRRKACLTNWFYRLMRAGVLMPNTEIIKTKCNLSELIDGDEPEGFDEFLTGMRQAVNRAGLPCFIRTGQTSGKHDWRNTCYLERLKDLERHIFNLIEYSECVDLIGLDYSVWAVRELLPSEPAFYHFNGMPITRERRYFAENGRVLCYHPYWFESVFNNLTNNELKALRDLNTKSEAEVRELTALTEKVSLLLDGVWSIDWLWTQKGWYLIDAAPAELSFHFEGCPKDFNN